MNNEEKIVYIKNIVTDFDKLVKDKEILNDELIRMQKILTESNKAIAQLKQLEIDDMTYENLVNEIVKQQSYINTINELAISFNKINEQISKYDSDKIEKSNEYILLSGEFSRLCEEIKIAEKLSKKSNEQKVETINAEGRKKFIDIDLIDYYNELVEKKKKISKEILNNYNVINELNVDDLIIAKPVQENISYQAIQPKKEYDPETVIKNMTLDDKIRDAEDRMQRIINTSYLPKQGKKRRVQFGDQHYSIPVKYVGRFNNLKGEINKLLKLKKDEEIKSVEQVIEKQIDSSEVETPNFDKQFEKIMQDISNIRQRIIEDRNLALAEQEALYNISYSNINLNNEHNTITENENPSKKVMPIKSVKTGNNIAKKIKRVAITVATVAAIAVTTVSGLNIFKSKDNKQGAKKIEKQVTYETDSVLEENNNTVITASAITETNDVVVSVPEKEMLPQNDKLLNEQILIEDGSEIYKTANDATNQINGLNPYYSYDVERNLIGVTVQMPDGSLINVEVHNQEHLQLLINQGGQITAYLTGTQNENGTYNYEGYYNVKDIEKESGGKIR